MGKNKHKHQRPMQSQGPTQSQGPIENAIPKEIQDAEALKSAVDLVMKNGFADALGYPANQSTPWSEQISQSTTLFKNLRWYFVSNMRQLLCELYVEIGLVSTIVDVPVDDALRGGIKIKSKQLDEDQILELVTSMDRDDDINTAGQAEKWNRLFGGAGILIMTDQDPMTPLDLKAIKPDSPLEFRAVDMWELFWDKQNTEGYDPEIQTQNFEFYNYYAKQIHKSRVIRLKGLTAPSFLRPRLRGWGFSVVERLVRSINQYMKATDLGFEVLDEFKLDIYKFKNLTNTLLSPIGSQKVKERVQMTNWQKNYQNAVVLDSEDDFDHKQLSFAGLAEAMEGIRMQVASDMRFPITKLFGTSASKGFATDQNDMEVYNSMVESEVRNKIKYSILRLIEIRCQQRFGFIPDDISIEFNPLRVLSATEEETVKTGKFNRLMMAKQAGEITTFEFREAVNKENLLGITLDNAGEELNPLDPEIARLVKGDPDPYHTTDVDDPGANREDTRKPRAWDTETATEQEEHQDTKTTLNADEIVEEMAPEYNKLKNETEWDESKHPRQSDGKFGTGGGSSKSKETKDKKETKEKTAGKFKGFGRMVEPIRENSKTQNEAFLCVGSGANIGKLSTKYYDSPAKSNCNLVGYCAFGKSSEKIQKELNETIQSSEIILTELNIKFKTPLDFVCQNVSSLKNTMATYTNFNRGSFNSRIDIKSKIEFSKSIMHEIGHALDYALSSKPGVPSSNLITEKHISGWKSDPEIRKIHDDLQKIVTESKFYKEASLEQRIYLREPTEAFARAFEVYTYAKAVELAEKGEIPEWYVENFTPDIFKTKDQKFIELENSLKELYKNYTITSSLMARETDPEKKEKLKSEVDQMAEDYKKGQKTYEDNLKEGKNHISIPENERKDYTEKISKLMSELLSKDSIKNKIDIFFNVKPYNLTEKIIRKTTNSIAFDRASYEAEGVESQWPLGREKLFENPGDVDESLWAKAKEASEKAFGKIKWPFVVWWYKKQGGKFKAKGE